MISASPKASQPHSHPIPSASHHTLNLGDGRLCLDSQKFRIPSLPVSSRTSDSTARRRERSIINGTAQPNDSNTYDSGTGVHSYLQHHASNNPRRTLQSQNDREYIREHNHNLYPSHHQSHLSSKKDNSVPSIFHQPHLSIEMQHRLQHTMPSNPSNFHQLCRSSMPVPCSSPAAATSASPKAMSPAKNALHSPVRSPQLPNASSNSQVDLSLSSPLKFYPGGFHPSHHPVSFYAAAAAAAASHHGIPYPLFGNHFPHPAAAAANSYNFHTNFLAQVQQQKEHQMNLYQASPSPPTRLPHTSINSPSPSSYTKFGEEVGGCSSNRSHNHIEQSLAARYGLDPRSLSTFGRDTPKDVYTSLLYSGLSKGGPLGLDRTESRDSPISPGNNNRQCAPSGFNTAQLNDERRSCVNNKFWNDSSLSTGIAGKAMLFPVEQDLKIVQKTHSHEAETSDSCSNNRTMLNGREGSLKHRFLTRSPEQAINSPIKAKMSKPIFTFPTPERNGNNDETHTSMLSSRENMDYTFRNDRFDNKVLHSDSPSVLFSSPSKRSTIHLSYTTYKNSELLPLPPPTTMAANTITTDSAGYLSQINKPSSTLSNLPMSPYLSPKSAQNYSPRTPSNLNNNNNASILRKKSETSSLNDPVDDSKTTKSLPLPVEQMPVIQAFKKGSLIQLASGQLKPVEDLKISDFHCAAATMTDSLRILHCTIVSIQVNSNDNAEDKLFCKVTMIVGTKQLQVVMDTTPAQPFFVVGRGWASCSPETTQEILQLSCSHLKVGDICITLTKTIRFKSGYNATTRVPKSPTIKHKSTPQSILSTVPRRASNLAYASKILKITNTTSRLLRPNNNETSRESSPKSSNKVKFEHREVPSTSSKSSKRTLEQSDQSIMDYGEKSDTLSKPTSSSEASCIDNFKEQQTNTRNESSSPKKRRWSDPHLSNDEIKSLINPPKRPNLSPVQILL